MNISRSRAKKWHKISLAKLILLPTLAAALVWGTAAYAETSGPWPSAADAQAAAVVAGNNLTAIHNELHANCVAAGYGNACGSRNPSFTTTDESANRRIRLDFCINESVNDGGGLTCNADYFTYCVPGHAVDKSKGICVDPSSAKSNGAACLSSPKPIAFGTGNKWLIEHDFGAPDAGQGQTLAFVRTYNSNPGTLSGELGASWRIDYGQRLGFNTATGAVWAYRPDGRALQFLLSGSTYVADADVPDRLYGEASNGYRLETGNRVEHYDTAGRLTSRTDAQGRTQTFSYDSQSRLVKVTDHVGRELAFAYDSQSRISTVTDPTGRRITYAYDAANNLKTVTYPDLKTRTYHYNEADKTGGANLPYALTGITDENGVRYMSYSYDSAGRAIDEVSPAVGSNTNRYQLNYDTDSTTVTDPLGNSSTYGFQTILGVPRSTGSSQPAGSGCGPAASTISYDANGNVASRTDFAGKITTYTYDVSRNLETQRVEASGTSNARTITTDWHGVWRLPTKIAEPRKLTSFIYNGDLSNGQPVTCAPDTAVIPLGGVNQKIGVLCRQTEQATTDSSGTAGLSASVDTNVAARNWNFTYDAAGRILTQTDPLGRVTTYAYYTDTAFAGNYDPYINQVSLLLHGNGADGSTTFVDSSPSPKTLTAQGNAKSATAQNKYGGASASFDGAGDYLTAPSGTEWNFAAGNFTVEAWIRFGDVSTHRTIVGNVDLQAAPFKGWVMRYDPISTPAGLRFVAFKGDASNTRDVFQIAWSPSTNVWYHVAAVRSGSTMLFFVDGQIIGSGTLVNATTIAHASGKTLVIGAQDQGASLDLFMNGHIDDLRISKGVARYTVAFTPPTQELPHVGPEIATGHSVGDLQSVSNPAGQVTNYDLYDKAGRVRKTTDLKGGVTEVSYTPRGWVSTVTVTPPGGTARTTSYTYDGIGQVTGVSLPDGTSLTYTYDDAHRLTAATDSRGNSVTYTLDAAGNRVGEEVRDPVSVLRRSIARSFDALNRVQQITGAAQ